MSRTSRAESDLGRDQQAVQDLRRRRTKLILVGLCVYWPVIFIISHIPKKLVPKNITVSGVGVHVLAYSVLTLLVFANAGLAGSISLRSRKTWLLAGVIAVYAMLDEYVQSFVQGRYGCREDWAVDVSACLVCVFLLRLLRRIRRGGGQFSKQGQG